MTVKIVSKDKTFPSFRAGVMKLRILGESNNANYEWIMVILRDFPDNGSFSVKSCPQ